MLSDAVARSCHVAMLNSDPFNCTSALLTLLPPAAKKQLGMDETAALEAEVDALLTSEVLQVKKVRMGGAGGTGTCERDN